MLSTFFAKFILGHAERACGFKELNILILIYGKLSSLSQVIMSPKTINRVVQCGDSQYHFSYLFCCLHFSELLICLYRSQFAPLFNDQAAHFGVENNDIKEKAL